jgi:hypothetical protein
MKNKKKFIFFLKLQLIHPNKRPDVSARLKNKKNIQERVVSCSLLKRLGSDLNDECRVLLKQEIDNWVATLSKVNHRLGIMFNRFLLYLITNNIPIPTFNDSLFNGMALHGMKKSSKQSKMDFSGLIDDFCNNEFNTDYNQFPVIKRNKGDCQAMLFINIKPIF